MAPEPRVFQPRALDAALALLAGEGGEPPVILAGGTDLMRELARAERRPATLVDISRVQALRGISALPDGGLRIGALTCFRELVTDPLVAARAPLLAEASQALGAAQTQARATLGGNLARGSSASDAPPAALAQGGVVSLLSRDGGERRCPLAGFFTEGGPAIRRGELIAAVLLAPLPPGAVCLYRKVGARCAQTIAKVLLAGVATLDPADRIEHLRLAAGAVGPAPMRLGRAEAAALGRRPAECALAVGEAAGGEVRPIDDLRSTAHYRRQVLQRLVHGFLAGLGPA